MTESVATDDPITQSITVVGERSIRVTPELIASLPEAQLSAAVVCATGNRYEATWSGVGIDTLCDTVDAPAATTHVVVASSDGYRMAVPILDALRGVVAFEKNGRPIGEQAPYSNRFVAPAIEGARDVKGVSRIEFHVLDPGEDPERLEQVEPDDDRFEAVRTPESGDGQTQ